MSKLTDLINQARKTEPRLGEALAEELRDLANRRTFGLVFEQHQPENIELPDVHPQRGDKVRILPPRGEDTPTDPTLWQVLRTKHFDFPKTVILEKLRPTDDANPTPAERREVPFDDVVVAAETGDTIYPGLIQTGEVHNGPDDAPAHVVINAENSHALRMLTYTHAHSVDVIYIDPPYNTGAKDWKYNNDYVGTEDDYRHSKWLSFMQRRLERAKLLLNTDDSVLIVTIDEKEVHRLGILLEQTFPDAKVQMVTIVIQGAGSTRRSELGRVEEYAFFLFFGKAEPVPVRDDLLNAAPSTKHDKVRWESLLRSGTESLRSDHPGLHYPVFIDNETGSIVGCGESKSLSADHLEWSVPDGTHAVWPIKKNGSEGRWRCKQETLLSLTADGHARAGATEPETGKGTIWYLGKLARKKIESGEFAVTGRDSQGAAIVKVVEAGDKTFPAKTVWNRERHHAGWHGTNLLGEFLPNRAFPFPKSLYSVEDTLRIAVGHKPNATVVDFFSGSGTTAHAVMRLNRQDDGHRKSISITNNEVSADEQTALRKKGLRPGDPGWEAMGICDYVTKPRVTAAITGRTPDGAPVKGTYKFTDEFDMADGFAANARFFTLTYESAAIISQRLAFGRIAPLLWLRAGQSGRVIDDLGDTGWDIADSYAVIENTDDLEVFLDALTAAVNASEALRTVFVVTDDDRQFQAAAQRLDDLGVQSHRLYSSYLTNFEFTNGDVK